MESASPICTYHSGDGVCFRAECPKSCVRNWRDQSTTDLPTGLSPVREQRLTQRRAWHDGPAQRMVRWLTHLAH